MTCKQRWATIIAAAALAVLLAAAADAQGTMFVKNNRVGVGTDNPVVPIHNKEADARVRVEATGAAGFRTLFDLINNGTPGFKFQDLTAGGSPGIWQFRMGGAGAGYPFVISNQGSSGNQFELRPNGDLHIAGRLFSGGPGIPPLPIRTQKQAIEAIDEREILEPLATQIEELAARLAELEETVAALAD